MLIGSKYSNNIKFIFENKITNLETLGKKTEVFALFFRDLHKVIEKLAGEAVGWILAKASNDIPR